MKKIFYPFLTLILFSGFCSAQKIIISGRVLSNDGKPLSKAYAEYYNQNKNAFSPLKINEDGTFSFETSKKYNYFRFSGVNHKRITVPVIVERALDIKYDILLPANSYTENFTEVKLFGNFNNWSIAKAVPLKKDDNGIFYADIESDKDTIEYELIGLLKDESIHSCNGTMSDDYKYDFDGDFKSVIYKRGKSIRIIFEPEKLVKGNTEAKINSETPELAEIRILREEVENKRFIDSLRKEYTKNPDFKPDFNASLKPIINKLEIEKDPVMREYYYFRYLYRVKRDLFGLGDLDSSIAVQALKQINPASALWSLEENLLLHISTFYIEKGQRKLLRDYFDKVISLNKDSAVVAEALWSKAEESKDYAKMIQRERTNPHLSQEEAQELLNRICEDYMKKNMLTEKDAQAHKEEIWSLYQAEKKKILDSRKNRFSIENGEIRAGKDSLAIFEESAKECFNRLTTEFQNTPRGKRTLNEFLVVKKDQQVPEFEVKSIDNSNVIYSDKSMKGNYYLIDFWATWCGPCIGEMPDLHQAYDKLKSMNFEILSISFDYSDEAVKKFRKEKYPMPWLHTRLKKNYDDELSKKFGVDGIPKMFLISRDGRILANDWDLKAPDFIERLEKIIREDLKNVN